MTWEELDELARTLGWDNFMEAEATIAAKFGYATIEELTDAIYFDPDIDEDEYLNRMTAEELEIWNADT